MEKKVTVIPASIGMMPDGTFAAPTRWRVAAYARVSTDSEEQLSSYESQVDYYTRYIAEKPEWDFV
jgi:hypothetical protein